MCHKLPNPKIFEDTSPSRGVLAMILGVFRNQEGVLKGLGISGTRTYVDPKFDLWLLEIRKHREEPSTRKPNSFNFG